MLVLGIALVLVTILQGLLKSNHQGIVCRVISGEKKCFVHGRKYGVFISGSWYFKIFFSLKLDIRRALQPIWNKAVEFIVANESRIRLETRLIRGEEFEVWHWLQVSMLNIVIS